MVQDVFTRLWEQNTRLDEELSIRSYLYTAVRNSCLNHLRHRGVKLRFTESELQQREEALFFRDTLIEEETHRLIYQSIHELPPKCREILILSMEGFKNQEIAEQMKISLNSVKTQKAIAYRRLRDKLSPVLLTLPLYIQHLLGQ